MDPSSEDEHLIFPAEDIPGPNHYRLRDDQEGMATSFGRDLLEALLGPYQEIIQPPPVYVPMISTPIPLEPQPAGKMTPQLPQKRQHVEITLHGPIGTKPRRLTGKEASGVLAVWFIDEGYADGRFKGHNVAIQEIALRNDSLRELHQIDGVLHWRNSEFKSLEELEDGSLFVTFDMIPGNRIIPQHKHVGFTSHTIPNTLLGLLDPKKKVTQVQILVPGGSIPGRWNRADVLKALGQPETAEEQDAKWKAKWQAIMREDRWETIATSQDDNVVESERPRRLTI